MLHYHHSLSPVQFQLKEILGMTEFINYYLLACLHYKCPRLD